MGHFCVSLFPLFGVYAVAPGLQCGMPGGVGDYDGPGEEGGKRGKRGSEVVGAPGREAFIKLALSLHRAIIAE